MPSQTLDKLVVARQLKVEKPDRKEFVGLMRLGRARLQDAARTELSYESRFDLSYNAAHALSLAALRRPGYRSENRYLVFQCLAHTLGVDAQHWRVLALAHERRNAAEYSGMLEADDRLLNDMLHIVGLLLSKLDSVSPPK